MLTFQEMYLEVYKNSRQGMVALYAKVPLVGDLDPEKYADEVGLKFLSFYMTETEFLGLMDGSVSGCNDIGHNVRAVGDSFTFFDMDFSSKDRGVMSVPFARVEFPYHVRRVLARAVKATLKRCVPDGDRVQIEIPLALRERWVRQYGYGKGQVVIDADEKTLARVAECSAASEDFKQKLDHVKRISQNSTMRHTDRAKFYIRTDGDDFYWSAHTPAGHRRMNGGIIDHGRDGETSWSVYT